MNCHKFNDLTQQKFIFSECWRQKVWNQFHWATVKVFAGLCSFQETLPDNLFLLPPAFGGYWHSLACGHITPISASVITLPFLLLSQISFRSDQISRSVVSDSLWPYELQHARPPCPSPTPGVHWDSRPSSQRCHPAISSSVIPFSSCPQSLPASESFTMSQLFAWGGQSTGVSASASSFQRTPRADLLQNGLVGSPCSPRDSQESSPTPQFKSINPSALSLLHTPTLTSIHDHRKNHKLD